MIRPTYLLPALVLGFTVSACGNLYLDAPAGANVKLLAEDAPAQVHVEQVVWFKYWGNEPFSVDETHAATIIRDKNLKEARVHMVNTFTDGIVSTFTGIFGFPRRTLVVEGNPYGEEQEKPSFDDNQAGKALDATKTEGGS